MMRWTASGTVYRRSRNRSLKLLRGARAPLSQRPRLALSGGRLEACSIFPGHTICGGQDPRVCWRRRLPRMPLRAPSGRQFGKQGTTPSRSTQPPRRLGCHPEADRPVVRTNDRGGWTNCRSALRRRVQLPDVRHIAQSGRRRKGGFRRSERRKRAFAYGYLIRRLPGGSHCWPAGTIRLGWLPDLLALTLWCRRNALQALRSISPCG
jgi:hypothetical protein